MGRGARRTSVVLWCALAALGVALAACGQSQPTVVRSLPGGTYASAGYHFRVTYPEGWIANASQCGAASGGTAQCQTLEGTATTAQPAVPLLLTITKAGGPVGRPVASTFTVSVQDLGNPYVAAAAAALPTANGLHATTVAGQPAYASAPLQAPIPGAGGTPSGLTDAHTDYYLVHGGYEYQLSTDAVTGDAAGPALRAMLASFTLTA
jgi:hypothetical protein